MHARTRLDQSVRGGCSEPIHMTCMGMAPEKVAAAPPEIGERRLFSGAFSCVV